MKQTLYDFLGVSPDAEPEEIKAACDARFEQLRMETTTDSNRFVLLNEAKEVLTDPVNLAAFTTRKSMPSFASPSGRVTIKSSLMPPSSFSRSV